MFDIKKVFLLSIIFSCIFGVAKVRAEVNSLLMEMDTQAIMEYMIGIQEHTLILVI